MPQSPAIYRLRELLFGRLCADTADRLGLAGNADIGADRRFAVRIARAVDTAVGPPAAIRRSLLHRDVFGGLARRNLEFGGADAGAGHCKESDRQCELPHVTPRNCLSDVAVSYRHSTLVIS